MDEGQIGSSKVWASDRDLVAQVSRQYCLPTCPGEGGRGQDRQEAERLPSAHTHPASACPTTQGPPALSSCLPSSLPEPQGPAHLSFSPLRPCSLTGISPFVGENDRTTLMNIRNYNVAFEETTFLSLSREARGFLIKVLVQDRL